MKLRLILLTVLLLAGITTATAPMQTPPGMHVILNGSTQYLEFSTPAPPPGGRLLREVSSRMTAARIGHGTDQVLFDWTGVGILYIRAVNAGVTNLEFVPASGTGTATVNISAFTTGFIYRFAYDDVGPNMAYLLHAWDARGDIKTVVSSVVPASVASIDPNNRTVRIGAKQDGTLHLQADIDFWRWHDQWTPFYPKAGELGLQMPAPQFAKSWLACHTINGNENWIDYQFESNLNNSGLITATLTATGSPTFAANTNTKPVAVGEDRTGVARGRLPLSAVKSFDYETSALVPTSLSDTLSTSWTCVSAPGGCGAVTIREPSRLFTWADATVTGTYEFDFAVTDGSLTDTDRVTIVVPAVSASVGDASCFVDEPCLVDASASTGWDSITVDLGERIPGSSLTYSQAIPTSVHRYHSPGAFTVTVTARDAQAAPATSQDTGTVTVTARAEADAANTEDLTNSANANYISPANCTADPTGNATRLQNAVDIAKARNTVAQRIIVPAGCRADGQIILKVPFGSQMITIVSSGSLPVSHKRVTPADESQLFTIRANSANLPAVITDPAGTSHHYKLRGLILETAVNNNSIIEFGQATVEDTAAKLSHHFIVQHCVIRPTNEFSLHVGHQMIYNANDVSIIDNYFYASSSSNQESHNTMAYFLEGRVVMNNNYFGGAAANYMLGGATTITRGMQPANFEIRENYFYKPPEWQTSHPSWDGKSRGIKNLWENKVGSNMVLAGNVLRNNWTDGQAGRGVLIQATCDSGNWATSENVDYSYNKLTNSERGINLRGTEWRGIIQARNLWLAHNLYELMSGQPIVLTQTGNVRMNHQTFTVQTDRSATFDGEMRSYGFIYENSITYEGAFGWFGGSTSLTSLNKFTPGHIFRDSLQVGGSAGNYGPPISGMQFPANEAAVKFTNPFGNVWSLAEGSIYRGDANDGTDPGVNWNALQAHIARTESGDWRPFVTMVTANLAHGTGTDALFNYQRQVDAFSHADIVAVQERSTGDTGWNTARTNAGFSEAVCMQNSSIADDNCLWVKNSTVTVNATYTKALSDGFISWDGSTDVDKSAVAAKVTANGRQFYVVATHLCWSRCADSSGSQFSVQRVAQINELLNWIATTLTGGLDVVILGDMNFAPDWPKAPSGLQLDLFTANYTDLWQAGITASVATAPWGDRDGDGNADMPIGSLTTRTADYRRIDYGFLNKTPTTLSLSTTTVLDTRAPCPHALVAGGALPGCTPEVTGGPVGDSPNQWDIPEDFGVRPADHNFVEFSFTIAEAASGSGTRERGRGKGRFRGKIRLRAHASGF
jgi:endonuclease/exonuclease/phosphatase family metal-dependent hydrolase